ncbi:MAG: hypothetical protein ACK4G2_02200 [Novosphingobium sp.]
MATVVTHLRELFWHEVVRIAHDPGADPDPASSHDFSARRIFTYTKDRGAIELNCFVASAEGRCLLATLLSDLQPNAVDGEAVGRDDCSAGECVDQELVEQALLFLAQLEGIAIVLRLACLFEAFFERLPAAGIVVCKTVEFFAGVRSEFEPREADCALAGREMVAQSLGLGELTCPPLAPSI